MLKKKKEESNTSCAIQIIPSISIERNEHWEVLEKSAEVPRYGSVLQFPARFAFLTAIVSFIQLHKTVYFTGLTSFPGYM